MSLQDTLGNGVWLKENEEKIKELLPETWTHIDNLNSLKLGFKLKLIGIDWRSDDQFTRIFVFLERVGIILRDGYTVRRNPSSVFK